MSRMNVTATIATAVLLAFAAGCGDKTEDAPVTNTAPAAPAASGAAPAQPERRVTTGADPDKAPPYPGMYGVPAGSK